MARRTRTARVAAPSHVKTGGEDINLHHTNLHNHLRNGEPLNCPIELGMAGVVAVNMANESWRSGEMMGWDHVAEKMVPADTLPEQITVPNRRGPSPLKGRVREAYQ